MTHHGSCLCRAITYRVTGPLRPVVACHCGQCRKQSGNVWASAVVQQADIDITGAVAWYASR